MWLTLLTALRPVPIPGCSSFSLRTALVMDDSQSERSCSHQLSIWLRALGGGCSCWARPRHSPEEADPSAFTVTGGACGWRQVGRIVRLNHPPWGKHVSDCTKNLADREGRLKRPSRSANHLFTAATVPPFAMQWASYCPVPDSVTSCGLYRPA